MNAIRHPQLDDALSSIRAQWNRSAELGLILGTGAGDVARSLDVEAAFSCRDLGGFPDFTAPGHEGELVCGTLAGRTVVAMRGRCHFYEGYRDDGQLGWPVALLSCESRGMIVDRTTALGKTLYHLPRAQRRIVSGLRVADLDGGGTQVRSSFAVFETLVGECTTVLASGGSRDVVAYEGGVLKFAKRLLILDAALVPNSLVFPL